MAAASLAETKEIGRVSPDHYRYRHGLPNCRELSENRKYRDRLSHYSNFSN